MQTKNKSTSSSESEDSSEYKNDETIPSQIENDAIEESKIKQDNTEDDGILLFNFHDGGIIREYDVLPVKKINRPNMDRIVPPTDIRRVSLYDLIKNKIIKQDANKLTKVNAFESRKNVDLFGNEIKRDKSTKMKAGKGFRSGNIYAHRSVHKEEPGKERPLFSSNGQPNGNTFDID